MKTRFKEGMLQHPFPIQKGQGDFYVFNGRIE